MGLWTLFLTSAPRGIQYLHLSFLHSWQIPMLYQEGKEGHAILKKEMARVMPGCWSVSEMDILVWLKLVEPSVTLISSFKGWDEYIFLSISGELSPFIITPKTSSNACYEGWSGEKVWRSVDQSFGSHWTQCGMHVLMSVSSFREANWAGVSREGRKKSGDPLVTVDAKYVPGTGSRRGKQRLSSGLGDTTAQFKRVRKQNVP